MTVFKVLKRRYFSQKSSDDGRIPGFESSAISQQYERQTRLSYHPRPTEREHSYERGIIISYMHQRLWIIRGNHAGDQIPYNFCKTVFSLH
jgi:hypothetical protein